MTLPLSLRVSPLTVAAAPRRRRMRSLGAVMAIMFSLALAACDGAEEREAAYFERGKTLYEEGNLTKARLEFKNARQINPLNMEALYYLGLIAEKRGKFKSAYRAFLKVTQQEPDHIGGNIHVGRMMLASNDADQAFERAKRVLTQQPENPDALALRAAVHLRRNDFKSARRDADAALAHEPDNLGANAVKAGVLQKEKKPDQAIAVLEHAIDKNPSDESLRLLLIELLRQKNDIDAVQKTYGELFKLNPKNHDYRVHLARILINAKRKDAAEQVLRDGVKTRPNDPQAKLILVDFLANQRSFEEAEAALKQLTKAEPNELLFRFSLSQLYARAKRPDDAEAILRDIADNSPSKPAAIRAQTGIARLRLAAGDVDASMAILAKILAEDSANGDALTTRGRIHLQRGDVGDAIADLRQVLRDKPDSKEALSLLADAHLRKREVDLASESLRLLLRVDATNDAARLRLARLYGSQQNYDKALELVDTALLRKPSSEEALQIKSDILLAQRRFGPALKAAERYRDVTANKVMGDVAVGRVYQAEGRHDEAIAAFERALDQDMESGAALTGLVRSYIATDRTADAMTHLKRLISKSPDNVYAHNLLGEVYAFDKVSGKAEKSFLQAAAIRGNWALPYINLGRLMVAENQPARAVQILEKGLQQVPDDTTLQFGLASAQQAAQKYEDAIDTYKAILKRDPSLDAAANNIAAIIADRKFEDPKSLEDALSFAQRFQVSENPYYLDTLGWVHYRRGDYNLAVVFLKRAVDQLPAHPVINYHLAMAYYKAGQREQARTHLEKAVVKEANYPEIDEARALLQSM